MAKLKIVKVGDDVLRKKCRTQLNFDERLHQILDDMAETMYKAEGVGLAAPQVGIAKRLCIVVDDDDSIMTLINPQIIETKGEQIFTEGCLSVPDKCGITKRPMTVTVRAMNRNGETFDINGKGLLAKAFCHEIDHLDGIVFVDKVTQYVEVEAE